MRPSRRPDRARPAPAADDRGLHSAQVLPTLFIPGFPKAATSWLWECMHVAFIPEMICPQQQLRLPTEGMSASERRTTRQSVPFDPYLWSKEGCGNRRFMLPGIACNVLGACSHRKELFFYGSGFGNMFTAGLAALHGPQVPLDLFATRELKPRGIPAKAWDVMKLARMESFCTSRNHTMLPDGRMHPACCVSEASNPKRWGCRWHEALRKKYHRSNSMWFQNAMPWVVPHKYDFATVDFTPNYLCTAKALRNIHSSARDPKELRFIVLMRDPIMRAFSEWMMFVHGWGWDHEQSLHRKFRFQMNRFKTCNATLFHNTSLLRSLPDKELFAYLEKCFAGRAMEYVSNSIYSVCVLAAQRIFEPEQFLFLKFEDLMAMKAPALLRLLSNFTGLHTDDDIIRRVRKKRECEAGSARKIPLSFAKANDTKGKRQARNSLEELRPELQEFFGPYNQLLSDIVHPQFAWAMKGRKKGDQEH